MSLPPGVRAAILARGAGRMDKARASTARRVRPLRAPAWPVEAENTYRKALFGVVSSTDEALREKLAVTVARWREAGEEKDRQALADSVRAAINEARPAVVRRLGAARLKAMATRARESVVRHAEAEAVEQWLEATGRPLPPWSSDTAVLQRFASENVRLISGIPRKHLAGVEKGLVRAALLGKPPSEVERVLVERYGMAQRKAALIAVDQVGKLQAQLLRARYQSVGVERYVWRTRRDKQVRRRHRMREGVVIPYNRPPEGGHPGQAVRCRCWEEPILLAQSVPSPGSDAGPLPPARPRRGARSSERVIERKGWSYEKVYEVPVAELRDVPATEWSPSKTRNIEAEAARGEWGKYPIKVGEGEDGLRELEDGNHRLAVARRLGLATIRVRFLSKEAAQIRKRPELPKEWITGRN